MSLIPHQSSDKSGCPIFGAHLTPKVGIRESEPRSPHHSQEAH